MQKSAAPAAWHAVGGGDDIAGRRSSPNTTPETSALDIVDLAAERARNAALPIAEQITRARELLDAAGLGHLRPDKAWRPRSWQDRLSAIPYAEDELIEKLAAEIYAANWREPSPEWGTARDGHKEWSRRQARAALAYLRSLNRGSSE